MSMSKALIIENSNSRLGKSKPYFLMFLIFALVISGVWFVDRAEKEKITNKEQLSLTTTNLQFSESLRDSLRNRLHLPSLLATIVQVNPKFATDNFDIIATDLIGDTTGIISLQLAPNGVVTHVTNIARNQAAMGHNLLTDPIAKTLAFRSINEQILTIAGPLTLRQGGVAIIARLPIFTNLQYKNSAESFWGFAIIVIDIDVLINESRVLFNDKYSVALRGVDSAGKEGAVFYGSQEVFDNPSDLRVINLPYGSWEIAIKSNHNLSQIFIFRQIWLWVIGGLLAIISSYLVLLWFNKNREYNKSEAIATELLQFIDTANAPIFGIDDKGLVNEWNKTAEKITGFKKAEVLGQDLVEGYITEDYQAAVKEVLDKALVGKETANYEFPLFTKDGRRVMVLLNSSTRRNAEGKITGVLGVGQDISEMDKLRTDLNEYKEALESRVESRTRDLEKSLEREKELGLLKSRFVTMASHEFRTPLTAINATSDIILRYADKMNQDEINLRLETIKNEVRDMVTMLEDILIIGKSDVQKLEYNPDLLDIVSLIKDIIVEYQLSEVHNKTIIYHLSSPAIMAKVDKKWIKNIVINLITNAIKYSDKDTDVEVSINEDQDSVSFSFKDDGIGISQEDIKVLFEPFYRGSNVNEIPGTGLGLVVLQKAVELHNGKIEIESELGKGSIFTIILPNV